MHIPSASCQALDIPDFETALALSGRGDAYDRAKWIYVPDYYTEYRYILGTRGVDPLICIGVNPSTAEPGKLDNTLKSVQRIAAANGYDSFIMFNVCAQRATKPDDMDRELDPRLHRANMDAFRWVLAHAGEAPAVWAAWGAVIEKRAYLPRCVRDMVAVGEEYGARWLCAGKCSKRGHPHHPLYLRKDEKTADFDVRGYLKLLEAQA
ncbi:MAG: DUF1643 domain-containing protein [Oscillospiraceae bacterium]|nr:DUF1643 domain-containing protein [Oscillospiraceae bacterium]